MTSITLAAHPMINPEGVLAWCVVGYSASTTRLNAINMFAGCWPNTPMIRAIEILEGKHEITYDDGGNAHVTFETPEQEQAQQREAASS
jgi:hypothetical protein